MHLDECADIISQRLEFFNLALYFRMEFLAVNPLGTVPVLVTADGHKEIGIVDIRKYLIDKHGDKQIFRGKCRHCLILV